MNNKVLSLIIGVAALAGMFVGMVIFTPLGFVIGMNVRREAPQVVQRQQEQPQQRVQQQRVQQRRDEPVQFVPNLPWGKGVKYVGPDGMPINP